VGEGGLTDEARPDIGDLALDRFAVEHESEPDGDSGDQQSGGDSDPFHRSVPRLLAGKHAAFG
jgi:hypothetical protein